MQNILCPHCKREIEVSEALTSQMLHEEREKFQKELEKIKHEEKEKIEKRFQEENALKQKDIENERKLEKERREKLMEDLLKAHEDMRELKRKDEEREITKQKQLAEELEKMRVELTKNADEKAKQQVLELTKKLDDTQKALEDAQRKSQQSSQQLQGEVLELELENLLRSSFPVDEIIPVAKGIHGADIRHIVKSPGGRICGVILWELKHTKRWDDKWLAKLKEDTRREGANIPVIVSFELPEEAKGGMGLKENVWIVSRILILPLAELLRRNLYDVAKQKAVAIDRTKKTDLLYSYVTGHEFQQQVERILDVYKDLQEQLTREKATLTKSWKQREEHIEKILFSTASIVGSMQGQIGSQALHIKGLELLEDGT